ncbi:microsomal glutathione S-transferase 1-like [Pollicipes pollicipes]|uniref:microsomal glutathione S-transferase 1-like n=1 Tax=Pollicipes pollicipes TaxID=41117 RepID=UPI001884BCE8|nr:microsomal glutathione S-transferase 1-like [Pollicipes pollicipes]XP_037070468.1 microsomal glutathione S-transferase 1-like [Pollicipes pollicipes]XP_037070478.1 microsomal glutathione S-transferase 1-like [Pollicipes pollicipes]
MAGFADLSPESPVFRVYLFWSALLVVKMMTMAFLTGRQRMRKNVFANAEDAKKRDGKVIFDDPDVERVRRAHLNDLENILPFLVLCPIYLATGPAVWVATNVIRTFAIARIAHTVLYLNEVPGVRGLAFIVGVAATLFMAGSTIMYAC